MASSSRVRALVVACLGALAGPIGAQYEVHNSVIPTEFSPTEGVDFGDADLDGDWDAAIADGGDFTIDQNRLWLNQGFAQGGTQGVFLDATAVNLPTVSDSTFDIEFADYDGDGDPDLYVSNIAQISIQGSRFWTNQGGDQKGLLGVYVDDTMGRWVGLGEAGSSISLSLVFGGTFIDWSGDGKFADLDNDGDLDLVHSSYGGAFGGETPTRIFLNDGGGAFREFNPSGFQLSSADIDPGDPGIWCEGVQTTDTTVVDGTECDVASPVLDLDVADIDGDFDLDILQGSRYTPPRMFANRLDGSSLAPSAGGLAFRDVTGAVFPPGYAIAGGYYEQELGDLDGDSDVDLYAVNWAASFVDLTFENDGSGVFGDLTALDSSEADDNEGDFVDYDNDGDLDLYVANFSGQDKLYGNTNNGGSDFSLPLVSLVSLDTLSSQDADIADTDGDGDYDVLVGQIPFVTNTFLRNTTNVPDTTAPSIPTVEAVSGPVAAADTRITVRAQVYDNAPEYLTWGNPTEVDVSVDGCVVQTVKARSSGGQIFRASLPGHLVGSVDYTWRSEDEYGNAGSSLTQSYTATGPSFQASFGSGTNHSGGSEPTLKAVSVPFAGSTNRLFLLGEGQPGAVYLFGLSAGALGSPVSIGPGLLTLNIDVPILTLASGVLDGNGCTVIKVKVVGASAGAHVFGQLFTLDGQSEVWASSEGLDVEIQ